MKPARTGAPCGAGFELEIPPLLFEVAKQAGVPRIDREAAAVEAPRVPVRGPVQRHQVLWLRIARAVDVEQMQRDGGVMTTQRAAPLRRASGLGRALDRDDAALDRAFERQCRQLQASDRCRREVAGSGRGQCREDECSEWYRGAE